MKGRPKILYVLELDVADAVVEIEAVAHGVSGFFSGVDEFVDEFRIEGWLRWVGHNEKKKGKELENEFKDEHDAKEQENGELEPPAGGIPLAATVLVIGEMQFVDLLVAAEQALVAMSNISDLSRLQGSLSEVVAQIRRIRGS